MVTERASVASPMRMRGSLVSRVVSLTIGADDVAGCGGACVRRGRVCVASCAKAKDEATRACAIDRAIVFEQRERRINFKILAATNIRGERYGRMA